AFFLMTRHPPCSTLFPYTTLFRSALGDPSVAARAGDLRGIDALLRRDFLGGGHHRRGGLALFGSGFFLASRGCGGLRVGSDLRRSEEHTSELQSRGHLVCRLLLAK